MTKRLYYTCPIKALYMIKEFGVKIYFGYNSEDSVYLELKDFDCFGTFSEVFDEVNDTGRLYVATESESIFKMDIEHGKLIVEFNKKFYQVIMDNGGALYGIEGGLSEPRFTKSSEQVRIIRSRAKIIMRGDKHFFQPKIEKND